MATMYARSALTDWNTAGGWSTTSGGASNGTTPSTTTDVIFDGNSGTARTITASSAACNNLTTTGASAITITGDIALYGPTHLFGGLTSLPPLTFMNTATVNAAGTVIASISCQIDLVLTGNIVVTGAINANSNFNAANFNVTAGSFAWSNSALGNQISMGSGTWTLNGTSTLWDTVTAVILCGTSTLVFTGSSAATRIFVPRGQTYYNIDIQTTGSGIMQISNGNLICTEFRARAGSSLQFTTGYSITAANFAFDGTGSTIFITTSFAGTAVSFIKSGAAAKMYFDYCSIKDITASTANTFVARNSINVSGNTGWTFIPGNSQFMPFF